MEEGENSRSLEREKGKRRGNEIKLKPNNTG